MSQKTNSSGTPPVDLSAFAGFFSPQGKSLGIMSGNPFMSGGLNNNPAAQTPLMGAVAGGAMQSPLLGDKAPKLTFGGTNRPPIFSPMRPNMMGGSPFFPFQF